MDTNAKKILFERFQSLPPALQQAIRSGNLRDKLKGIAEKFKLHIDQAAALENQTVTVMMGLQTPLEYAKSLEDELLVSEDTSYYIAEEVNKEIFLPIREHLKKLFEDEGRRAEEEAKQRENIPQKPVAPQSAPAPKRLPGQDEETESPEDILAAIEKPPALKVSPAAVSAPKGLDVPPAAAAEVKKADVPPLPKQSAPEKKLPDASNPLRSVHLPSETREIGRPPRPTDPYREPVD